MDAIGARHRSVLSLMNPRAAHFGAEEVDLRKVNFPPELLASIPAELARRYRVLPVFNSPHELRLALADPSDLDLVDSLNHLLKRHIQLCVAEASQLDEFIERLYGHEDRA
jgi:type IV pilus assembly protein PilB